MRPSTSNQRHYQQHYNSDIYMLTPGSERYIGGENYASYNDFSTHTPPVYPSPCEITVSSQDTSASQLDFVQDSMSLAMVAPLPAFDSTEERRIIMSQQQPSCFYGKSHQKPACAVLPSSSSSTPTSASSPEIIAATVVSEAALSLSLNIEPSISVTEPTPIHRTNPSAPLDVIDQFIAKHSAELEVASNNSNDQLFMNEVNIINSLLSPNNEDNNQWLSWTPLANNSPASVASPNFDLYAPSPDFGYVDMTASVGFPSPNANYYQQNMINDPHLSVRMMRERQYSEPPMPTFNGYYMPQQQQQQQQVQSLSQPTKSRKTRVEKRPRSNSTSATHTCMHPGCGKTFTRPYNLTSHMRTHTLDRPFACTQCGRRFARQHDRNRHEKLHWGIKPYACNHCRKPFARMDALNRHLRVENGCGTLEKH